MRCDGFALARRCQPLRLCEGVPAPAERMLKEPLDFVVPKPVTKTTENVKALWSSPQKFWFAWPTMFW